jgi:ATP/ADP translocase
MANVFLLLFAYYVLKTVREALILTESGAQVKAYSSAGQAALLMIAVPLYGWIGTLVNRIKLLAGLSAFFIMNLLLFSFFGTQGAKTGIVFYIWVGIFNVFIVSQFWAFANDIYTEAQGKRLFPMIGIGASLGAWLGAQAAGELVKTFNLLQSFAVSRIFRFLGVQGALYVLPLIALGSYLTLAIAPFLAVVRVAKTLENATDYSLQNTVKQALFLPAAREVKYKAKAAIDTFFMRLGDVVQAGVVALGTAAGLQFTGICRAEHRLHAGLALDRQPACGRTPASSVLAPV